MHLAARVTADWHGLLRTQPEMIASLTLVCPTGLEASPLRSLAAHLLLLPGDQGAPAEAVYKAMADLPEATLATLHNYFAHPRADILSDRADEVGAALLTFLARLDQARVVTPAPLPAQEGEFGAISYWVVAGSGLPVVHAP